MKEKLEKQVINHELVYGVTRNVHNFWLINTEKKWMLQHNRKYHTQNYHRITETRGFEDKFMNSIFGNTTIKLFQRAMISRLGEYISVRDNIKLLQRTPITINDNCSIVEHEFLTGKRYIVKTTTHNNCSGMD